MDLRLMTGLSLRLMSDGLLVACGTLALPTPKVRTIAELEPVLASRADCEVPIPLGGSHVDSRVYFMYRGVALPEHQELFGRHGLRYDITVLRPGYVAEVPSEAARECVKTYGHYHPREAGSDIAYPEVYEVLYGKAVFVLQTEDLRDVVLVRGESGDKILIPPGYGHVTVNVGTGWLVLGNLVSPNFDAIYEPYRRAGGAAVYLLRSLAAVDHAGRHVRVMANPSCGNMAPRWTSPRELGDLGLFRGRPLYTAFVQCPGDFEYLVRPSRHAGRLDVAAAALLRSAD